MFRQRPAPRARRRDVTALRRDAIATAAERRDASRALRA